MIEGQCPVPGVAPSTLHHKPSNLPAPDVKCVALPLEVSSRASRDGIPRVKAKATCEKAWKSFSEVRACADP